MGFKHWALSVLSGVLFVCGTATAGTLTIHNCSTTRTWVGVYNDTDTVRMIAASDACIKPGESAKLTCATAKCHVKASTGAQCFPSSDGYQASLPDGDYIFFNGTVWRDQRSECPRMAPPPTAPRQAPKR